MKGDESIFAPFIRQNTVVLTTFRRDGTPVETPVHIAIDGDRAFIRTYDTAWKYKRIRANPAVTIAPSTVRDRTTGPAIEARAQVLEGDECALARAALARKYPILHGLLIPRLHHLRRNVTIHIGVTPVEIGQQCWERVARPEPHSDGREELLVVR